MFLYDMNKEFIQRFDGVVQAAKELNMGRATIKRYALQDAPYKGYFFRYERLIDR